MEIDKAIDAVQERFPFKGYMGRQRQKYRTVGRIVRKYLDPGDRVYDFGSGPCDKTAVVACLGMECTAYDDLQDAWHKENDNREKIRRFAVQMGIDFVEDFPPGEEDAFDMVMMNDVLEHLHESPREILTELVDALRDGGYLFCSVPNLANIRKRLSLLFGRTNLPDYELYFWYPGTWRGPVREYVRGDLERMVDFMNLETVELRGAAHMMHRLPSDLFRPIYRLMVRLMPGLADTWVLVARKPGGWDPASVRPE